METLNNIYVMCLLSAFEGKKVLSSDEHDSDSGESLSNDYPKGWGPRHKKSSPHASYDELQEEEYLHLQEAAENSVSY